MRIETKRLSVVRSPRQEESCRDGIASFAEDALSAATGCSGPWPALWAIVERQGNALVGSACLNGSPDRLGCAEIDFRFRAEIWREPEYAGEAVRALVHWALAQAGVQTVATRADPENSTSRCVLEKCGFVPDGAPDAAVLWRISHSGPFVCPLCGGPFIKVEKTLTCAAGHAFDIARQGYVNLLSAKSANLYDENKALFPARRNVYAAGFFDPLLQALRARLPEGTLLDAGCGEGSLLRALGCRRTGLRIGVDIARSAVQMAAASDHGAFWCVGDVCRLPLPDASVAAVVNMLTPANYTEFARVLREGGTLVKVVPNAGHLREIRALAGKPPYRSARPEPRGAFGERFIVMEEAAVRYTIPCGAALAASVYRMTPLTAHVPPGDIPAGEITVDVTLLTGRSRGPARRVN